MRSSCVECGHGTPKSFVAFPSQQDGQVCCSRFFTLRLTPVPECALTFFDRSEYHRNHVSPIGWIRRVVTRCRRIWSRMDVVTCVVTRWMTVPPVIERSNVVFFVVVQREVAVLEPRDLQLSRFHSTWIEPRVIRTDEAIRSELGLLVDPCEPLVCGQPIPDDFVPIEIDRCTADAVRSASTTSGVYLAITRSLE